MVETPVWLPATGLCSCDRAAEPLDDPSPVMGVLGPPARRWRARRSPFPTTTAPSSRSLATTLVGRRHAPAHSAELRRRHVGGVEDVLTPTTAVSGRRPPETAPLSAVRAGRARDQVENAHA
jgi:hypothetical protein